MGLRIVTWNVNGIRNPFSYEPWRSNRSFASMFDMLEADIVIFQETKIQRKDLRDDMVLVPGWDCYFSLPAREKGKFGVVIYTRQSVCAPIRAEEGLTGTLRPPNSLLPFCALPEEEQIGGYPSAEQMVCSPNAPSVAADFDLLDSEGRCVILEFPAFVLFGVYAPATRDETRVPFRIAYHNLLDARIRNLVKLGKRVVLTGDLNVSKSPIDIANVDVDIAKSGVTVEEYFSTPARRLFNHLVAGGTVWGGKDEGREDQVLWDVCRSFHPDREGMYTHWETKRNARPANFGSRIDYILCSLAMKDWFSESNIQEGLMGSDHCPVFAILKDRIQIDGKEEHTADVMNPPGMFKNGKRLREHSKKDILPTSGRLIPDFTGRQSIRDMFTRKPGLQTTPSQGSMADRSPTKEDVSSSQQSTQTLAVNEAGDATAGSSSGSVNTSFAGNSDAPSTGAESKASGKRLASDKSSDDKSAKKARASAGNATMASPQKGQSQISGFFRPSASAAVRAKPAPETGAPDHATAAPDEDGGVRGDDEVAWTQELDGEDGQGVEDGGHATDGGSRRGNGGGDGRPAQGGFVRQDPARELEQVREGWAKLFSKPQVPLCEHGEACKQMLSKKQGPNYMRSFYMCARPLGPSGDKERGTQWRCRTFIWLRQAAS